MTGIIGETNFMDCENLPQAMVGRFDRPWHFVGEVDQELPWLQCFCKKCNEKHFDIGIGSELSSPFFAVVSMQFHLFVTDDMIEVVVYFGVCETCDLAHWARVGPPFRRAPRYHGAETARRGQ